MGSLNRYLGAIVIVISVAVLAVLTFNLIIDPLNISPVRVQISGINSWKPFAEDTDRITKRFEIKRLRPVTLFMGSSRVKQAMDPTLADGTEYAPTFNAAMNGSADLAELSSYLTYFLAVDPNVRHIFIEVFPIRWFGAPEEQAHHMNIASRDWADLGGTLFSERATALSIRTVYANWTEPGSTVKPNAENGYFPLADPPHHHFSIRNVFNFMQYKFHDIRGAKVPNAFFAALASMAKECADHQVDCRFFISPLHADVMLAWHHLGVWSQFEIIKRVLANIAPTYDFTQYNDLLDERDGPVLYWPEAFHFSPSLGGREDFDWSAATRRLAELWPAS
jgi:hypothetical protein